MVCVKGVRAAAAAAADDDDDYCTGYADSIRPRSHHFTRVPGTFENKELVVVVHDVHCCFKKKSVTNEARE